MTVVCTANPNTGRFGLYDKEAMRTIATFDTAEVFDDLTKYEIDWNNFEIVLMEYRG